MGRTNEHASGDDAAIVSDSSSAEVRAYLQASRDLGIDELTAEELSDLIAWGSQFASAD